MMSSTDLRTRRKALRLTQAEIAARLGVSRLTWQRWEAGEQAPYAPGMLELALWALENAAPEPLTGAAAYRKVADTFERQGRGELAAAYRRLATYIEDEARDDQG